MIQLAQEANASRMDWLPGQTGKDQPTPVRTRPVHAWPFISRYTDIQARPASLKDAPTDQGS